MRRVLAYICRLLFINTTIPPLRQLPETSYPQHKVLHQRQSPFRFRSPYLFFTQGVAPSSCAGILVQEPQVVDGPGRWRYQWAITAAAATIGLILA